MRKASKRAVKVSASVVIRLGGSDLRGTVLEDRGTLGPNGERIFRVEVTMPDLLEGFDVEVPEDRLSLVA